MKEIQFLNWCDKCVSLDPASRTTGREIDFAINGERHTVEICADHEQELLAPFMALVAEFGVKVTEPKKVMRQKKEAAAKAPPLRLVVPVPEQPPLFKSDTPRVYECPSCGYTSTDRNKFLNHLRNREGVIPPTYTTCPHCGGEFKSAAGGSSHMVKIHGYDAVATSLKILQEMMARSGESQR